MNPAHLHLVLNHIPVVGLGAVILFLLYAVVRKNDELKRVCLAAFVLIALTAIAVFLSGKASEDKVEHLSGVSEAIIEQHEEAAVATLVTIEILGVVSLGGLIFARRSNPALKWLATGALVISLVAGGLATWTANLGGQIRHTEIRNGPTPTGDNPGSETEDHERKGRDER